MKLWGHSAGTALARPPPTGCTDRGISVSRLFLAAPATAATRPHAAPTAAELAARADAEITARLARTHGYPELAELDPQHAEHVGAAYRHDVVTAHHYFADLLDDPDAQRLAGPGYRRGGRGRPEHRRGRSTPRLATTG